MSCIPKILEIKGDKEFIRVDPREYKTGLVIEGGGEYKGYHYLITFNRMGFRCGYVALPPGHPTNDFFNESYNYPEFSVHGGITFFDESSIPESILGEKSCKDKINGSVLMQDTPMTSQTKNVLKNIILTDHLLCMTTS